MSSILQKNYTLYLCNILHTIERPCCTVEYYTCTSNAGIRPHQLNLILTQVCHDQHFFSFKPEYESLESWMVLVVWYWTTMRSGMPHDAQQMSSVSNLFLFSCQVWHQFLGVPFSIEILCWQHEWTHLNQRVLLSVLAIKYREMFNSVLVFWWLDCVTCKTTVRFGKYCVFLRQCCMLDQSSCLTLVPSTSFLSLSTPEKIKSHKMAKSLGSVFIHVVLKC